MYTERNFKTKKALREAFALGARIGTYYPGLGDRATGRVSLEGPHYPAPHAWYADAEIVDFEVVKLEGKTREQWAHKLGYRKTAEAVA